jgi:hypothetical protein
MADAAMAGDRPPRDVADVPVTGAGTIGRRDLRIGHVAGALLHVRSASGGIRIRCRGGDTPGYSIALTMSSTTFFASPNTIIVLSM